MYGFLEFAYLGGIQDYGDIADVFRRLQTYADYYQQGRSLVSSIQAYERFPGTCKALADVSNDLPEFVRGCQEWMQTGHLLSVTTSTFEQLHTRFYPNGKTCFVTEVDVPFKRELKALGLSDELASDICFSTGFGNWAHEFVALAKVPPQRDSLFSRIEDELVAGQMRK